MSQAGAKYKKEFVIYKHKNPEYVLFLLNQVFVAETF